MVRGGLKRVGALWRGGGLPDLRPADCEVGSAAAEWLLERGEGPLPGLLGMEAPLNDAYAPFAELCLPDLAAEVGREGHTQATVPVQVLHPPFL